MTVINYTFLDELNLRLRSCKQSIQFSFNLGCNKTWWWKTRGVVSRPWIAEWNGVWGDFITFCSNSQPVYVPFLLKGGAHIPVWW